MKSCYIFNAKRGLIDVKIHTYTTHTHLKVDEENTLLLLWTRFIILKFVFFLIKNNFVFS